MFLQKKFQLSMQRVQENLKYTVPKVALFLGVKMPMQLTKNPQRIVIKIPCPSSKHKTAPVTAQRTHSSECSCSAVIPKELS